MNLYFNKWCAMSVHKNTVKIDGSYGEGGGQILRTACALSAITCLPCYIYNIRKTRKKPGLKTQHLMGIRTLAELCNGRLEGDISGSQEIFFHPGGIKPSTLNVEITTAGSITLVLQTLLLPAFYAPGPVKINFYGGATDTFFSPTMDYYRFVFFKHLERIGLRTRAEIIKRGFYPRGNARVGVEVVPSKPVSWHGKKRGPLKKITVISGASRTLKNAHVAERQANAAEQILFRELASPVEVERKIEYYHTLSSGSQINIIADCENTTVGSDALGERGKRAEIVGSEVAQQFIREINSGACLDRHAGDQILPFLSLAQGSSEFTVSQINEHTTTNIWVIEHFLKRAFHVTHYDSCVSISIE